MRKSRKLLLSTALLGVIGIASFTTTARAADVDVDATLVASEAITINKSADMDFAAVDYTDGAHSGSLVLAPNGTVVAGGGSAGLVPVGSPTAGQIDVTSSSGTIDVSCDATATLDDGTRQLTMSEVKFDFTGGTYLAATACAGLNTTPGSIDTGANNDPSIFIGGTITIGANALDSSVGGTPYVTSAGLGTPVSFRVVYQ